MKSQETITGIDALDDLAEQGLQLFIRRRPYAMKSRNAVLYAINTIKYQAVQRFPLVGKG